MALWHYGAMTPTKTDPTPGKARFPVYLDPALLRALRIRALEEGQSATKIVETLIADFLKRKSTRRTR